MPVPMTLPACMPYLFWNSSATGTLLPSGSAELRAASAASLARASSAASRTALPMWNSRARAERAHVVGRHVGVADARPRTFSAGMSSTSATICAIGGVGALPHVDRAAIERARCRRR